MNRLNGDDRYLADTLNSLADFPHGYTPNLQSKWELLETSLAEQQQSKRAYLWRWRIAASVLLFALLALLFNQPTQNTSVLKPTQWVLFKPKQVKYATPLVSLPEKPINKRYPQPSVMPSDSTVEIKNEVLTSPEQLLSNVPVETPVESPITPPAKKQKTRYVQLEFGELSENTSPAPFLANGLQIKLRSSVASQTLETYGEKNAKSLRIRF